MIATVLPNVSGLDRAFDYLVPDHLAAHVEVGTIVRVDLHGRRVGGWVIGLDDAPDETDASRPSRPIVLKPIAKVTGRGPSSGIIELAEWAAIRWAAHRIRPFLLAASPTRAVTARTRSTRAGSVTFGRPSPATTTLLEDGGGVLRLPPRADVLPAVVSAVAHASRGAGSALVIVPEHTQVTALADRLRRTGISVAEVPDQWASADGGVDVVIGSRSAAWAPCPGLAAAVVVDEHDDLLQEERAPTWHARDVVVERCRRAGVPFVLVSPIPTVTAVETCSSGRGVVHPDRGRERSGWPIVTVVHRSEDDPWKRSLVTSELIERLRAPGSRVVCVSNITGRARVLACRHCRALIRCEHCHAAVGLDDAGRLVCRRCATERPPLCQECGRSSFANLRPGVTRLREELEAAANRPVAAVTAATGLQPGPADITVGTEAVLHRVGEADIVVFLEFDSEMLAPRFRASEQALALIVRAGRIAPEVMIQTFTPDHEVLRAACLGDPGIVADAEGARRRSLGLPPFASLARISGDGADEFVAGLDRSVCEVGGGPEVFLVRASEWMVLGEHLNAAARPAGSRLRIEVDPARV